MQISKIKRDEIKLFSCIYAIIHCFFLLCNSKLTMKPTKLVILEVWMKIFCAIYLTNKENQIIRRRKKKQIDFYICKIQGISCRLQK